MSTKRSAVKRFGIALGLTALLSGVGCNKNNDSGSSQSSAATPGSTIPGTAGSTATPAVTPAATLAGVYNALSDVENSTNRRHQQLTLNADMTAELDTDITASNNPAPVTKHTAIGTYAAKSDDVTVTLKTEDGNPIPASNTTHVMHLTAQKNFKSLLGDDGRSFERAK